MAHAGGVTLCVWAWRMAMYIPCASPLLGSPGPMPGEQCCGAGACGNYGCGSAFPQQSHQVLPASAQELSQVGHPIFTHQLSSWARLTIMGSQWAGYLSYGSCAVALQVIPVSPCCFLGDRRVALEKPRLTGLTANMICPNATSSQSWGLVWVPTMGLGSSTWCWGWEWQAVPLQAPTIPSPPRLMFGHKQLPSRWQTTLHLVGTVYLPIVSPHQHSSTGRGYLLCSCDGSCLHQRGKCASFGK